MFAYRILRWFLRRSVGAFFRRVEVVGQEHVPPDGPIILCGNHNNSLLDPVLISCFCGRVVHFAAKDVLFKSWLLRPFLEIMGAVPVRRRMDHPDGPLENERLFDQLFDGLSEGRAVAIFPEGISHDSSQLAKLKTGVARVALGAVDRHPELPVRIVPCGLNYVTPQRFRSSVLVQFGPPISIDAERMAAYRNESRESVRALTGELDLHLRALTVNADDWETVRVLDGLRRLYQPPRIRLEEKIELARRFNTHFPEVKDEPQVRDFYRRVQIYLDRLAAEGLTDRDLRRPFRRSEAALRFLQHLLLVLVWLPLTLLGSVVHFPVGLLLGLGKHLAPRKDVVATTKFMAGFFLLMTAYVGIPLALGFRAGWPLGLAAAVALPLSGYATLRVLERLVALRRMMVTGFRLLTLRRELALLRAERETLARQAVRMVNTFKPDDLELMFPRPPVESPDRPT